MAQKNNKNPNCVEGPLYVDNTCIDCWTCLHIGKDIFKLDSNSLSFVARQPQTDEDWVQAKEAILSCPVNCIGVINDVRFNQALLSLPRMITDNIFYCGYTSRDSYGGTSYFLKTSQGNILIDSPKFNAQLVQKLKDLGGVDYMFLSHKDDVADHQKFAEFFHCKRIIHRLEVEEFTCECEIILEEEKDIEFFSDVQIIFTPGHSKGHLSLLYKNKYLFTGDHLFYSHDEDKIFASQNLSWHSWEQQKKSIAKLLAFDLEWIFPGHGGWCNKTSLQIKRELSKILV